MSRSSVGTRARAHGEEREAAARCCRSSAECACSDSPDLGGSGGSTRPTYQRQRAREQVEVGEAAARRSAVTPSPVSSTR